MCTGVKKSKGGASVKMSRKWRKSSRKREIEGKKYPWQGRMTGVGRFSAMWTRLATIDVQWISLFFAGREGGRRMRF
jgi:hypothetical protein